MRYLKYLVIILGLIICGCNNKSIIIPTERLDIECRSDELSDKIFRVLDDFKDRGLVPISIKYYPPFNSDNVRIEVGGAYTNNIKVVKTI